MKSWLSIALILLVCLVCICLIAVHLEQSIPQDTTRAEVIPRVSFYHYFSGTLSGGMREMVELVNQRQPTSEVVARALDHEAYKSLILTSTSSESPPEMFAYWAGMRVQNLVDKGVLAPLDSIWDKKRFDEYFSPSIIKSACIYNGHKYLVPMTQYVVVFFYDKKRFEKLGLKAPVTWNEFLQACHTLKKNGITPISLGARERWPAQFWFDYILLRTAGPVYRQRLMEGSARYNDPEVRKAYEIWKDLILKGFFNRDAAKLDWAEGTRLLCERKVGMTLMGTWALQTFKDKSYHLEACRDFEFFSFPVIKTGIPDVAVGPIDGIVLPRNSPNHDAAIEVLPRFTEEAVQQVMSRGSGCLAPSNRVPRTFYDPLNARIWDIVHRVPHWAFNYDLATPAPVAEVGMNSFLELLAYPEQYQAILENVDREARSIFASRNQAKSRKNSDTGRPVQRDSQ